MAAAVEPGAIQELSDARSRDLQRVQRALRRLARLERSAAVARPQDDGGLQAYARRCTAGLLVAQAELQRQLQLFAALLYLANVL